MFRRIIIGILSVVLAGSLLCGCTFFSHDNERDMRQVVAYVEAYDIENSVRDESDGTRVVTYHTTAKDIYKQDLVDYINNNYESFSQSYPDDPEGLVKYALSMLVNIELVENEVDALIDAGLIEWGLTEQNSIKREVYGVIDTSLTRIKNEILDERDNPSIETEGDSDPSTETTYPVKPDEENEDEVRDTEEWAPDLSRYPGLNGDEEERSLGREAMRRFISLIKERTDGDFRATSEDRQKFKEDAENIDAVINTKGIEQVYPMIGSTHMIYYLSGKSLERSQKIRSMQSYLTDNVTVDPSEVIKSYNSTLASQRSAFTANVSEYDTAMKGDTTVLYHPNTNYFYVKHILLPFSDEQKAELTEYKERINVSKDDITAFRDRLAEGIVCYPHVDGEDDKSRPMTVSQVMNDVRSKMLRLSSNVKEADLAFDDLIYLYNTDPGAFGNNKGYVVKYKLDEGESETYMQEFADAAREMRDTLGVGQVYGEPVVTDYGVHIMYLASVTKMGAVPLYGYTTPGEVETYYDVIEEPIRSARENTVYQNWENNVLSYNYKRHSTQYEKRFSDLWED